MNAASNEQGLLEGPKKGHIYQKGANYAMMMMMFLSLRIY